jgi:hypothetical protein
VTPVFVGFGFIYGRIGTAMDDDVGAVLCQAAVGSVIVGKIEFFPVGSQAVQAAALRFPDDFIAQLAGDAGYE